MRQQRGEFDVEAMVVTLVERLSLLRLIGLASKHAGLEHVRRNRARDACGTGHDGLDGCADVGGIDHATDPSPRICFTTNRLSSALAFMLSFHAPPTFSNGETLRFGGRPTTVSLPVMCGPM